MTPHVSLALALLLFQRPAVEPAHEGGVLLTREEIEIALELSPLAEPPADPSNAVEGNAAAARLGQALFFDQRFSGPGTVSCATCHHPERSWTDGKPLAAGVSNLSRHTMTLWNVAHNRWFFWDGRKDTLWSQALAPLEDPREHATSRLAILHQIAEDPGYASAYTDVFGALPELADESRFPRDARPVPGEPEHPQQTAWAGMSAADQEAATRAYTNLGKAIAAFERKLVSRDAPFDRFVRGLRSGDARDLAALDARAQRGLALFVGRGRCVLCHDGPNFTDLEFHDNRVPVGEVGADPGRKLGILRLRQDPLNSESSFADDGGRSGRDKIGLLIADSHGGKQFKTPTLRNVARTAPYMHEGQFATLAEVIDYYSTLANATPEDPSERLMKPLELTAAEKDDLRAFLESLTDESLPQELRGPPPTPNLPR